MVENVDLTPWSQGEILWSSDRQGKSMIEAGHFWKPNASARDSVIPSLKRRI